MAWWKWLAPAGRVAWWIFKRKKKASAEQVEEWTTLAFWVLDDSIPSWLEEVEVLDRWRKKFLSFAESAGFRLTAAQKAKAEKHAEALLKARAVDSIKNDLLKIAKKAESIEAILKGAK